MTAYCYENDADMEALKSAHYVDDTETYDEKNNHFLEHDYQQDKKTDMVTVMGFQHRTLPLWGVQFHPESVSTEHGLKMMANFQQESMAWMTKNNRVVQPTTVKIHTPMSSIGAPKFKLYVQATIPTWIEPDGLLDELLSTSSVRAAGWLDSSRRASPYSQMSTLSIDPALFLTYSTLHKQLRIQDRTDAVQYQTLPTTFFDYVSDLLVECGEIQIQALNRDSSDLPFKGGLVGYFGYEMKRESLPGYVVPDQQQCLCKHNTNNDHCCLCKEEPDAAFQFVDRFWSFDITRQQTYLCCLVKTADTYPSILEGVGMSEHEAMNWMENSERLLLEVSEKLRRKRLLEEQLPSAESSACTTPIPTATFSKADLIPDAQHDTYLKSIQKCIDYIKEGESYEICLTTRFRLALSKELSITDDLWRLYTRHLRKNNPAPFSALLMFPQMGLLSSSPERFLKVGTDGVAEMKPIKGTVGRVLQCVCTDECDFGGPLCMENRRVMDEERKQQLWQDVKERAENLMVR